MEKTYFVSDVHLGLDVADSAARERRFVSFLRGIDSSGTSALYLLGDIFDFWYEYKYVVPKGYARVFAAIQDLIEAGVKVYFCPGNHDIWAYHYFEELGMIKIEQPCFLRINSKSFCIGHGDGLGMGLCGYRILNSAFKNTFLQFLFSLLHPRIAFALGKRWSRGSRLSHDRQYVFKGESEPLYRFCQQTLESKEVDYFIFGHYHCEVDMPVGQARLLVMKDWISSSDYLYWDGMNVCSGHFPNTEK